MVPFSDALVVLHRGEDEVARAVADRMDARLRAFDAILDDDGSTGVAECLAGQHRSRGLLGLLRTGGHDHAFACAKAVGLDDRWCRALADVVGGFLGILEDFESRRRNPVLGGQALHERLGSLELGSGSARSERGHAAAAKTVGDAVHERRFGANHHQVDPFPFADSGQIIHRWARRRHGHVVGNELGARIARRHEHPSDRGRPCEPLRESVLAAPAAHDQHHPA